MRNKSEVELGNLRIFIALVLVYLINMRTLHAKIRYNGGDEPEQVACFKVK